MKTLYSNRCFCENQLFGFCFHFALGSFLSALFYNNFISSKKLKNPFANSLSSGMASPAAAGGAAL